MEERESRECQAGQERQDSMESRVREDFQARLEQMGRTESLAQMDGLAAEATLEFKARREVKVRTAYLVRTANLDNREPEALLGPVDRPEEVVCRDQVDLWGQQDQKDLTDERGVWGDMETSERTAQWEDRDCKDPPEREVKPVNKVAWGCEVNQGEQERPDLKGHRDLQV